MIKPGDMTPNWKSIFRHLRAGGFDVYAPGKHKGKATDVYIVLRRDGVTARQSMAYRRYELLIYVPIDKYSEIEEITHNIKMHMQQLAPFCQLITDDAPDYLDDDVGAYMTAVTYIAPQGVRYTYTAPIT